MSIASELTRVSNGITGTLAAIAAKDVTVPEGSGIDECPALVASITGGTPSGGAVLLGEGVFTPSGIGSGRGHFDITGFDAQDFDADSVFELKLSGKASSTSANVTININDDYAGGSPNAVKINLSTTDPTEESGIGGKYLTVGKGATAAIETYDIFIFKNVDGKIVASSVSNTYAHFTPSALTYVQLTSLVVAINTGDGTSAYFVEDITYSFYKIK